MRKGKLIDETPFLGIKVEHFVTKRVFALAIASHCWYHNLEFSLTTPKSKALEILKSQLHCDGNGGVDTGGWDGADETFTQYYNDGYNAALTWIEKNYPYLK